MSALPDFDFRYHLFDTIILLGGKREIANILKKSLDGTVTEADVDVIRQYNIGLIEYEKNGIYAAKVRLNILNSSTVRSIRGPDTGEGTGDTP